LTYADIDLGNFGYLVIWLLDTPHV
jgi:hypothetical protein